MRSSQRRCTSERKMRSALAALADYASSSSSSDASDEEPAERKPRIASPRQLAPPPPPPPPSLDASSDSSVLADGRIRQFPHMDGFFAVHVYMRLVPNAALSLELKRYCNALVDTTGDVHVIDERDRHLSLSRTVSLRRSQIDGFAEALRVALSRRRAVRNAETLSPPINASVMPRPVELANDTRTRHFAALELDPSSPSYVALCQVVDAVDAVFERYGLPRFYDERRLHFSFAWALKPISVPLASLLSAQPASASSVRLSDEVEWRIGERVTSCAWKHVADLPRAGAQRKGST